MLFDKHGRMVLGLCQALLRDEHEAEDAAQQTYLSAYRSLLAGTTPREPAAWLATIARNECRSRIRRRPTLPEVSVDTVATAQSAAPDLAEVAEERAEVQELRVALAELPERQREAVVLRDFYGLSYDEVGAAMSASPPAVESLLLRARRRLEERVRGARAATGALTVPLALREELARLIPGFDAPVATGAVGVGAGGALVAKLASIPAAAKITAAVGVVAVGAGVGVERKSFDEGNRLETVVARPVQSTGFVPVPAPPSVSRSLDASEIERQGRQRGRRPNVSDAGRGLGRGAPEAKDPDGRKGPDRGPRSPEPEADRDKPLDPADTVEHQPVVEEEPEVELDAVPETVPTAEPDNSGPGSATSGSGSGGSGRGSGDDPPEPEDS